MAETFNSVRTGTPDSSAGILVAGDIVGSDFLQAVYLVHGATGAYERAEESHPFPVEQVGPDAGANSSVNATVVENTVLLAANASRRGATFFNEAAYDLYLSLSAAASAAAYTLRIAQYGYYELPYGYRGAVTGVWPSAPAGTGTSDGYVRITELT